MPKLLLFDIDGTLVWTGGAGRRAIKKAFEEVHGDSSVFDTMDFSGRTDRWIIKTAIEAMGGDATQWAETMAVFIAALPAELAKTDDKKTCPGIPELMTELHKCDDCCLGLLTGNFEVNARVKLAPFNLNDYFPVGGFSDDHMERPVIARQARAKAERYFAQTFATDEVYVIGDTEFDIDCGKANGFKTIAVATGNRSCAVLAKHRPDFLFTQLTDVHRVITSIWG